MQENHPLGEVFGFPIDNTSAKAERFRMDRLCPFNNRVPSCTKERATNPLGVCSIVHNASRIITCPARFTEDWIISADAAGFFFGNQSAWTSLREVRLEDVHGNPAGNIDYVLVQYDREGRVIDFGAVEVHAVYISGNVRKPFEKYMGDRTGQQTMVWEAPPSYYPTPDYFASSRKRLVPQLLYKGGILSSWKKKTAVVMQESFFETIPELPVTDPDNADMAWLLYDLEYKEAEERYALSIKRKIYTRFSDAIDIISKPRPGKMEEFIAILQQKLDDNLGNSPDAPVLTDIPLQ